MVACPRVHWDPSCSHRAACAGAALGNCPDQPPSEIVAVAGKAVAQMAAGPKTVMVAAPAIVVVVDIDWHPD